MSGNMLVDRQTAQRVLSRGQSVVLVLAVSAAVFGLVKDTQKAIIGLIAAAVIFWVVFVGFRKLLWIAAGFYSYPPPALLVIDGNLPSYTIFVPLYKEGKMLPKLVEAINRLKYPKDKLEVLLLLEADDEQTW